MIMSTTALWVAFAAMLPLMAVVMYSDAKTLKIPNWTVLAVVGVYIATGSWGLDFDIFLWRLLHGVIALVVGFLLYSISGGNVGAGDVKLIASLTPFVPGVALAKVLVYFAIAGLALLALHQIVRLITRKRETGWKAFDQSVYLPMGIALGVTILVYFGLDLAGRMAGA